MNEKGILLCLTAQSETPQPPSQLATYDVAQPNPLHTPPFRLRQELVASLRPQPIEQWSNRCEPARTARQEANSLLEQRVNPLPIVESFAEMRGDDADAAFILETLLVSRL